MPKVEEVKKVFTYRAKPSVVKKAAKKVDKKKTTLSETIENLLNNYANETHERTL